MALAKGGITSKQEQHTRKKVANRHNDRGFTESNAGLFYPGIDAYRFNRY
jgi:hypothetical protein